MQVAIKGHKFELPGSPVVLCLPPKRAESFCRYHGRHPSDVQTDPTRQKNEKGRENNGRGNKLGGDTRKMGGAFNRPLVWHLYRKSSILDPRCELFPLLQSSRSWAATYCCFVVVKKDLHSQPRQNQMLPASDWGDADWTTVLSWTVLQDVRSWTVHLVVLRSQCC